MPISTIVPTKGGGAVGWDGSSWVPVDPTALQGSTLGNLGRGAALGFRQIGQGVNELLFGANDPNVRAAGQVLAQQSEAASNAAPYAMALGMGAPEVVAGVGGALATGGMAIPEMVAAQMVIGGGMGALRPGTPEQRVMNAVVGSVVAGSGEVLGIAAVKGIGAAMRVGKAVTSDTVEATAQGVVNGLARQQNAEARAAIAASAEGAEPGAVAGAEMPGAGGPSGAGSVGAAATPAGAIDPLTAAENAAMDQGEAIARGTLDRGTQQAITARGEELGYQPAYWAGTPKGSQARLLGSLNEFNPGQPGQEIARKIGNQELINRAGAKGMGAAQTLDPVENLYTTLDIPNMGQAREYLNQGQAAVLGEMPGSTYGAYRKVLQSVERPDDPGDVGEVFRKWMDKTMGDVNQAGDAKTLTGQGLIRQIRNIGEQIGNDRTDSASREAFIELQNKLYNFAEQQTRLNAAAGAHGGDPTITGRGWAQLRQQETMYRILRKAGAIDPQGNINARTVLRAMSRDPTEGGFGVHGPLPGSPQRDLWDLLQAHLQNDLANTVPPTGVRVLGALGRGARGLLSSQIARTGAAGAAAAGAANTIWGR